MSKSSFSSKGQTSNLTIIQHMNILSVLNILEENQRTSYSFQASIKYGIGANTESCYPLLLTINIWPVFPGTFFQFWKQCYTQEFLTYSFSLTMRNIAND